MALIPKVTTAASSRSSCPAKVAVFGCLGWTDDWLHESIDGWIIHDCLNDGQRMGLLANAAAHKTATNFNGNVCEKNSACLSGPITCGKKESLDRLSARCIFASGCCCAFVCVQNLLVGRNLAGSLLAPDVCASDFSRAEIIIIIDSGATTEAN